MNRTENIAAAEAGAACELRDEELKTVTGGDLMPARGGGLIIVELNDLPKSSNWIRVSQPY